MLSGRWSVFPLLSLSVGAKTYFFQNFQTWICQVGVERFRLFQSRSWSSVWCCIDFYFHSDSAQIEECLCSDWMRTFVSDQSELLVGQIKSLNGADEETLIHSWPSEVLHSEQSRTDASSAAVITPYDHIHRKMKPRAVCRWSNQRWSLERRERRIKQRNNTQTTQSPDGARVSFKPDDRNHPTLITQNLIYKTPGKPQKSRTRLIWLSVMWRDDETHTDCPHKYTRMSHRICHVTEDELFKCIKHIYDLSCSSAVFSEKSNELSTVHSGIRVNFGQMKASVKAALCLQSLNDFVTGVLFISFIFIIFLHFKKIRYLHLCTLSG